MSFTPDCKDHKNLILYHSDSSTLTFFIDKHSSETKFYYVTIGFIRAHKFSFEHDDKAAQQLWRMCLFTFFMFNTLVSDTKHS